MFPDQADIACTKRERGVLASRLEGELHQETLVRRIFLHMDDSVELIDLFSGVVTSRDSNGYTM